MNGRIATCVPGIEQPDEPALPIAQAALVVVDRRDRDDRPDEHGRDQHDEQHDDDDFHPRTSSSGSCPGDVARRPMRSGSGVWLRV